VNISVNGEHPGVSYSGVDSVAVTLPGSALTPAVGSLSGEDRLSVTPATLQMHTTFSAISASRASRVSRLQSLYASGRYDASASKAAQSIVSAALTNSDKL
jgi:hypothetical protein